MYSIFVIVQALLVQMLFERYCCFLLQTNGDYCPNNCTCTAGSFICSNNSLLTVPWIPRTPHCRFDLSENHIITIQAGIFKIQSSNKWCSINFDNNYIHTISDGAFDWLMNASTTFSLRHNNLTSIPKAFEKLTNLRVLYLSGNPLLNLNTQTMVYMGRSLTDLSFDMGLFQYWPHELQYLRKISVLEIGYIPFSVIPQNAFHGLETTLRDLQIHSSRLEEIPHAFCIFQALHTLNFSLNHHRNLFNTRSCTTDRLQVTHLYFNDNDVKIFPDLQKIFYRIPTIQANNNGFLVMDGDSFDSSNFTVYDLNLNMNNFSRIPFGVNYLKSLHKLYIAYNSISSVVDPDISKLEDLIVLGLKGNPILYISKSAFNNNLKLSHLDLSETWLHQIPAAVIALSNLYSLGLDNTQIVCTCDLAYLKTWNETSTINDESKCYLSSEKIKDYLQQSLVFC
ncbi:leucine-rich repeats and immunoglobulin-like domains protein 3 [Ruditapes philippinarum]|uniref:leucine-rich repeats and immunoglobulin-like domains protein 3 n=1 Tax=Ruditapes philippinarum TaxID=129788 RepID=UPI00295BDC18|nr:leucine-rich repeats and immunoglobulin-like domains protein 3 [Ruditapes philippinarum]